MPIYLTELIEKLPSDTAERVKRAKDKHNTKLREALRHETGLKLTRGASDSVPAISTTVPIKIVAGVPAILAGFTIPDEHRLSLLISPWRDQLRQIRDSAKNIEKDLIPALRVHSRGFDLMKGRQAHLTDVKGLADDLLKEGDKYDLAANAFRPTYSQTATSTMSFAVIELDTPPANPREQFHPNRTAGIALLFST